MILSLTPTTQKRAELDRSPFDTIKATALSYFFVTL